MGERGEWERRGTSTRAHSHLRSIFLLWFRTFKADSDCHGTPRQRSGIHVTSVRSDERMDRISEPRRLHCPASTARRTKRPRYDRVLVLNEPWSSQIPRIYSQFRGSSATITPYRMRGRPSRHASSLGRCSPALTLPLLSCYRFSVARLLQGYLRVRLTFWGFSAVAMTVPRPKDQLGEGARPHDSSLGDNVDFMTWLEAGLGGEERLPNVDLEAGLTPTGAELQSPTRDRRGRSKHRNTCCNPS